MDLAAHDGDGVGDLLLGVAAEVTHFDDAGEPRRTHQPLDHRTAPPQVGDLLEGAPIITGQILLNDTGVHLGRLPPMSSKKAS